MFGMIWFYLSRGDSLGFPFWSFLTKGASTRASTSILDSDKGFERIRGEDYVVCVDSWST